MLLPTPQRPNTPLKGLELLMDHLRNEIELHMLLSHLTHPKPKAPKVNEPISRRG